MKSQLGDAGRRRLVILVAVMVAVLTGCTEARPIRPSDIDVPKGSRSRRR